MPKIYLSNNYIVTTGDNAGQYATNNSHYEEDATKFRFYFSESLLVETILFTDIANWTDENSIAYTELSLRTFLRSNTTNQSGVANASLNVGGQLDAGNRLRVSQLTTQLDIKQTHDNQPLYYDRENISGGTQVYVNADGGTLMGVTASSGDAAICQSKMFANYFAGKGQFIEVTFDNFASQTDVTKRAGYFTSNIVTPFDSNKDGIWFESDGSNRRFIIEKDGTEILNVVQEDWNVDIFEGRDWDNFTVLAIDFLYLGGTAVRLGFIDNGIIKWGHIYIHSGEVASTFVLSPNKPIRYEIRSTGGAGSFNQICAQVASEGSVDEVGINTEVSMEEDILTAATSGTYYVLAACELKSTYRDVMTRLIEVDVLGLSNNDYYHWEVRLNPTVTGTLTYSDITNSALRKAVGDSSQTVTGGKTIAIGKGAEQTTSGGVARSSLRLGSTIDGTQDQLVLCITPMSGNSNLSCSGGFMIEEFI